MQGYINSQMHVLPASSNAAAAAALRNAWIDKRNATFCTHETQDFGTTNHTCVEPCLSGLHTYGCLPPDEAYVGTDDDVFVATHMQERQE